MPIQENWTVKQLDIPTAFLNGKLSADVYIYPPDGLQTKSLALKLNRALYGLKESPKVWNDTFHSFSEANNLKRSKYYSCLYVGEKVYLLL